MLLTLEQAVENHKKLWNGMMDEIKENGIRYDTSLSMKRAVIVKLFPELTNEYIRDCCFLCEYAASYDSRIVNNCAACPMVREKPDACLNGLYEKFDIACNRGKARTALKLAEKIRDLPVINPLYEKKGESA